jgi:hypothetical protein
METNETINGTKRQINITQIQIVQQLTKWNHAYPKN